MTKKDYQKQWKLDNKKKIIEYSKQYYLDNKEKMLEHDKQWRVDNSEKIVERSKQWYFNNKERLIEYYLEKKYDITLEQYNELLIKQDFCCAICGKHVSKCKKRLAVDHDHITGEVRGLLCMQCNIILGNANDDVEILLEAINYLNKLKM